MKVFEKSCCQGSWTGEASGLSNEWKLVGMLWGWHGRPAVGVLLGIPRTCCSSRVVCVHSLHRLTVFVPHPIILRCSWTSHSRDPLNLWTRGHGNVQNIAQCLKDWGRKCWRGSCRERGEHRNVAAFLSFFRCGQADTWSCCRFLRAGHPDYCSLCGSFAVV